MVTHLGVIRMTWCQSFPPKLAKKGHITTPGQPPEPSLQSNPMFALKPETPGWINTCEPTVPGTRHWEPVRLGHREHFQATPQPILFGQKNGKTKTEKQKHLRQQKKPTSWILAFTFELLMLWTEDRCLLGNTRPAPGCACDINLHSDLGPAIRAVLMSFLRMTSSTWCTRNPTSVTSPNADGYRPRTLHNRRV